MINDALEKVPQTIEAVVYLNKRLPVDTKGGYVFGNYRGHKAFADMNITVESSISGGYPVLLASIITTRISLRLHLICIQIQST